MLCASYRLLSLVNACPSFPSRPTHVHRSRINKQFTKFPDPKPPIPITKLWRCVTPFPAYYLPKMNIPNGREQILRDKSSISLSSSSSNYSRPWISGSSVRTSITSIFGNTVEYESSTGSSTNIGDELEIGFQESFKGLAIQDEEELPSSEVAPGVFEPHGSRFKNLNRFMTTMGPGSREFQIPLQKLAKGDRLVLPQVPDRTEKYAYVKTKAFPLLCYLIFSLISLTAGMWYEILCNLGCLS